MIPGHRSEIGVPTGVQGNEGDKLDFRVWPDENGLLGRYDDVNKYTTHLDIGVYSF